MPYGSPVSIQLTQTQLDAISDVSAKANKDTDAVPGNLTQFTTGGDIVDSGVAAAQMSWQFAHQSNTAHTVAGALTLTPGDAANQRQNINANVTSLVCVLSATYPYVIWTITTDGEYTLDLTGWETDGGNSITLTNTGTDSFVLYTPDGGTTKFFAKWMEAAA